MAPSAGSRLGPYEIVVLLGAGGMGEVYRAHDRRLGRDVAVKVLPASMSADPAALERFEREARAVAALSHPNIVALFDIGQDGATTYVVSELLEGQTLRDRLAGGPVPTRKAIEYSRQIADALSAAHERGIVHRDLKPENIFVTTDGRVKVLDFGLAQFSPAAIEAAATISPTPQHTSAGLIVGTVGYMAPEQIRAQQVDPRADIFALGAVMFEMLTGTRAFRGDSSADVLAAVLQKDPPAAPIDAAIPPPIDRLVRRCLEKSPAERFQSARDLGFALDATSAGPVAALAAPSRSPRLGRAVGAAAAAVVCTAAAFVIGRQTVPVPAEAPTTRFGIAAANAGWFDAVSVSPDGHYIVYTGGATASGINGVNGYFTSAGGFWLRATDSVAAQRLPETEQANPFFFWSPDSRALGYTIGDVLVAREIPNGTTRRIAQLPSRITGVTWGTRGEVVASTDDALYRVPASGGTPRLFLKADLAHERWRSSPSFLPDGERLLYTTLSGESEGLLETRAATVDGRELGVVATGAIGTAYADDHLVFGSHGALYVQRFDVSRLRVVGDRLEIASGVAQDWRTGSLAASVSNAGVIAFRSAVAAKSQFTLVDRGGNRVASIGNADDYLNFDVSPDAARIVTSRRDPLTSRMSLWLIDIDRGITTLISDANDEADADDPTWAPDGRHIVYRHGPRLVMRLANGGEERTLVNLEAYPDSFTRDGRYLTYGANRGNLYEQWLLDITTPGSQPVPIVTGVTMSDESKFSPNGRWIAYHANQTGVDQVYVVPFPLTGEKWQVSETGGVQPRWSTDGSELFYLTADGKLMAVSIPDSDPRRAAPPKQLFATQLAVSDAFDQFAVRHDRFVVRAPVSTATDPNTIQVVVNWKSGSR